MRPAATRRRSELHCRHYVMITAPSGQRIAFEIQYSPIKPEKWRERHDSYVEQGIRDIWLLGVTMLPTPKRIGAIRAQ